MNQISFSFSDFPILDAFHVPAAADIFHIIFADDIEIVLILGHFKSIEMNQVNKLSHHIDFTPFFTIDDQDARIEIFLTINA